MEKKWLYVVILVVVFFAGVCVGVLGAGGDDHGTNRLSYKSALAKAKSYSDFMHMSKQGIYDQLTSEYGEKFPEEAAQYAIDNLNADYNKNALEKAKDYQKNLNMSTEAIREQLTSEYGEKFTEEEADYAVSNLPQ